jgi:WD40 repeat protein
MVRLWGAKSGRLERSLEQGCLVAGVAFSADSKQLASAGSDGVVRLWDPAAGKLARSLSGHRGLVWSVAFAPDGKTLASGGTDRSVRLWPLAKDDDR